MMHIELSEIIYRCVLAVGVLTVVAAERGLARREHLTRISK